VILLTIKKAMLYQVDIYSVATGWLSADAMPTVFHAVRGLSNDKIRVWNDFSNSLNFVVAFLFPPAGSIIWQFLPLVA
jgi:hypothetical protein